MTFILGAALIPLQLHHFRSLTRWGQALEPPDSLPCQRGCIWFGRCWSEWQFQRQTNGDGLRLCQPEVAALLGASDRQTRQRLRGSEWDRFRGLEARYVSQVDWRLWACPAETKPGWQTSAHTQELRKRPEESKTGAHVRTACRMTVLSVPWTHEQRREPYWRQGSDYNLWPIFTWTLCYADTGATPLGNQA